MNSKLLLQDVMEKFDEMLISSPTAKPVEPPSNPVASAGEGTLRKEIEELKDEVDLWKDRCMAAEQALDATIEHYEQELDSHRREW